MKFELPPPIPSKRRIPPKQDFQEQQGAPTVNNGASKEVSPADRANTAAPEPDRSNEVESIRKQEVPEQTALQSDKPSANTSAPLAGAFAKRTIRSTPWLVVGFSVLALGLLIVWVNSSSPTQTVSSNSGSYSAPMTETPATGPSTNDSIASQVTASTSESSPAQSPSVDESELKLKEMRDRYAAAFSAASPSTSPEPSQPATAMPQTYHVIKVKRGDSLKVRTGPRQTDPVNTTLALGTRGILLLPERIANGSTMWQKILVGGHTGWVNEIYLEADFPRAVPRAVEAR